MVKRLTSMDAPSSLKNCYPELAEHLNDTTGFYLYVKRLMNQFGLLGRHSPNEVMNECLIRWHKAIQKGKTVPKIAGWMRVAALNIVRELDREAKKASLYDPEILNEMVSSDLTRQEEDNNEEHQLIQKALKTLSKEKQELLELRWFNNMSWEDIAALYNSRGESIKTTAVRKRGQRALEEVRKVYLEMCS